MIQEFKDLGISIEILKVIKNEAFTTPTEIQKKTIPLILKGNDVIASSATGSGKTLAFSCGIIQNCTKKTGIQSLILCPTRELADQVAGSIRLFSTYHQLKIACVYGGVPINFQIKKLKTADIVIGTPGRVLDHIARKTLKLAGVKTLILDEADRLVDMGFLPEVEKIIHQCPMDRQTLLYTATLSDRITDLAKRHMRKPITVAVDLNVDPKLLKQVYYSVDRNMKFSLLVKLLKEKKEGRVMVFCNCKRFCTSIAKNLRDNDIPAEEIHGDLIQKRRSAILKKFFANEFRVLVCTDVAARGLHIPDVTHVYNYDVPQDSRQYIHRIGRTARAGAEGLAVTILTNRDIDYFRKVRRENATEIVQKKLPELKKLNLIAEKSMNHTSPKKMYGRRRKSDDNDDREDKGQNFRQGRTYKTFTHRKPSLAHAKRNKEQGKKINNRGKKSGGRRFNRS
ncbi:ATP-dependent RNA helicase [Candidatus Woesearchaeota archaeon CG11_big_fil_rev_8_21_14_0_20_43_8]|nr:MAG: ATP-dependent RNA helicase [Candidatus Woesearchaeota archaeon CG11_big_fil_rev_8_21_14_0_20_43_8]PIO09044.1 MAG: ATP-dependent helicase [Candidatus Woesearchaeota archaeon CG08_land_8_20_14_0_20_43_7]